MKSASRRRAAVTASLSSALVFGLLIAPRSARALSFIFNAEAGTSQQAIDGFTAAGNLWSGLFTDNVTINISIAFTSLGPNILADTGATESIVSYSAVRSALIADATSPLDAAAVANLQTGDALQFVTNTSTGASVRDNDSSPLNVNSANNRFLDITSANAKALGLLDASDPGQDAMIRFSSDFTYDFDRSDGVITSGSYDFVGLAAHEIGHALGFISGVDTVDYFSGPTTGLDDNGQRVAAQDLNPYAVFNTLDLFRFSSASTDDAGIGFGVPDLRQGAASYFSVDKGVTGLGDFSTGPYDGDGRQASHWKDNRGLGVMDPTAGGGELLMITENDQRLFDAIGWNLRSVEIPEPSTLLLMSGVALMLGGTRLARRRKQPG